MNTGSITLDEVVLDAGANPRIQTVVVSRDDIIELRPVPTFPERTLVVTRHEKYAVAWTMEFARDRIWPPARRVCGECGRPL